MTEFVAFPKIRRVTANTITITEKIDGTNAAIHIKDGEFVTQSRNRIITPGKDTDNCGFSAWANERRAELTEFLGEGLHFGEWWGLGIQRNYGMKSKVFSLFNVARWGGVPEYAFPEGLRVVPRLYVGTEDRSAEMSDYLRKAGSLAAPGFMNPEGIMVYYSAFGAYLKAPFDPNHKGVAA